MKLFCKVNTSSWKCWKQITSRYKRNKLSSKPNMQKIGNFVLPKKATNSWQKTFVIYLIQKMTVFFKYLTHFAISNLATVTIVPEWHRYDFSTIRLIRLSHSDTVTIASQCHCYDCSTVRLLPLLHSEAVAIVPQWHCYDCPAVTMLWLFHNGTVTIVLQWHCYDCSTVTMLWLFHSGTVTIVPQWHCCDCSILTLLRLFHSETVTIVPQWHCYNCYTVTLLRLFHSDTAAIVPQWHCYNCSIVTALRYKFYGLLTLFRSDIYCCRITTCTRNTTWMICISLTQIAFKILKSTWKEKDKILTMFCMNKI